MFVPRLPRSVHAALVGVAWLAALAPHAAAQRPGSVRRAPPGVPATAVAPCEVAPPGDAAHAQTHSLQGLVDCNAPFAGPWSGAYTPDGSELWISLFGAGFGSENCQLARFDAQTWQLLGLVPVGLGPEEIAFVPDGSGGFLYAFATTSSSSEVSVITPAGQVVRSIPIPFDPASTFQTAFPFGLAVSPDGTEVFVGTLDGSGDVFVIEVPTLTLATDRTLSFGPDRGFGRLLFAGDDLVLPTTRYHAGFQGSTAEVILVDPDDPAGARTSVLVTSGDASAFPSPQDAALLCEGVLFVAGFDMGAGVWTLHVPTGAVTGFVATQTATPQGKFQGLGLSSRGLLAVGDLFSNEIALIDAWSRQWLATVDAGQLPGFNTQLNELVFSPDGARLTAVAHASDTLVQFDVQ